MSTPALAHTAAELEVIQHQRGSSSYGIQAMIDDSLAPLKNDVAAIKGQHEQLSLQVEGVSKRMDAMQESIGGIKEHLDRQAQQRDRKAERMQRWVMFLLRLSIGGGLARWLAHKAGIDWPEVHHP